MSYNFKEEKDVKEYLKNLLLEYKFSCYSERNPETCHLLGEYYATINQDFKLSAEIFKKNCDNMDHGRSCSKFGGQKFMGKGCERGAKEGYQYMKRGCELNDEIGCANAGIISITSPEIHGENKNAIVEEGVKMLTTACYDKKVEKACSFLAAVYLKGIEGSINKNPVEMYRASLKSCEFGNPHACSHIAKMHEVGEEAKKDEDLAKSFKARAEELLKDIRDTQRGIEFHQGIKP